MCFISGTLLAIVTDPEPASGLPSGEGEGGWEARGDADRQQSSTLCAAEPVSPGCRTGSLRERGPWAAPPGTTRVALPRSYSAARSCPLNIIPVSLQANPVRVTEQRTLSAAAKVCVARCARAAVLFDATSPRAHSI